MDQAAQATLSIIPFLNKINNHILNPLIALAFAIALLVFFWGIFQFIRSETADTQREKGKSKILWGLVGMFIMVSAFGLIRLILNTFGLSGPNYPNLGI
jgi:uncharacterized membrane protein